MIKQNCQVKRCKQNATLTYQGKRTCLRHWEKHCDPNDSFNLKNESINSM